jgi:hypothetical protein
MMSDQYVTSVVRKYAVETGPGSPAVRAANETIPVVEEWAGKQLLEIGLSGSYAKGTAISLGTDIDIFISLDQALGQGMKEIYWSLFQFCVDRQWRPRAQNVSVRIESGGLKIDLVPGRKQKGPAGDQTLYRRKKDSWLQTNVAQHIKLVAGSGRSEEIRALKIWRERNHADFPSFYLELTTLEALKQNRSNSLAVRTRAVLHYLADGFMEARVVDPANTNNVISDELDLSEKRAVMNAARTSLQREWEQILW